jgi:hypothetical protein
MCIKIIHTYHCSHTDEDVAPCASSRTTGRECPDSQMKVKESRHQEKCSGCKQQVSVENATWKI